MAVDLESIFDDLERMTEPKSKDVIVRAPFNYPGGKSKSIKHILPHLPYRGGYVEPFGGSAAVLLARNTSRLEVFNDRYAGVVAFYRCIRDKNKMEALCTRLDLTIHSREEFVWCKQTWENVEDDVERAARWYYTIQYSFAGLGRNFGRSTSTKSVMSGKLRNRIPEFFSIHERIKRVQIENQDWYDCLKDFDDPDTVFYLDPPYLDASAGIYKHEMTRSDHQSLLDTVFSLDGFVAVSGYSNPLYEEQDWDDRFEWDSFVSIQSIGGGEGNKKSQMTHLEKRETAKEILWIKE